jgi:polar amino acid transport system substrate-binding protein
VKEVVFRDFGSWASAQQTAKEGKADIIFGIYRNDERETYLNYIDPPFMLDPVAIAVRKGEKFSFAKWDDLAGKKGVTNAGESYGNEFDAFMTKKLTVERAKGVDKAYAALLDKKADYLIVGSYPGRNEAKKLGIDGKIEFLPKELNSFGMYVAFSKKSKCFEALKDGFSTRIKEYSKRGAIQQLLNDADKKWSVNK